MGSNGSRSDPGKGKGLVVGPLSHTSVTDIVAQKEFKIPFTDINKGFHTCGYCLGSYIELG